MQHKRHLFAHLFTLLLAFLLFSCEEDSLTPPESSNEYLLDYELLETFEANQLRTFIALYQQGADTDVIRYDVEIYKVTYLSSYQGQATEASGLVCIPAEAKVVSFPFFLGLHASISSQSESPSNFSSPLGTGLEFFAALGYVSVIPDYLGFGVSSQFFHPYLVRESVTQASVDMIKATEEMMEELDQTYEQELYMAGYSQGGYNTMATLYAFENESLLPDWEIGAAAAGAGAYDLEFLTQETVEKQNYASPEVLAYLIWSYHIYYQLEGGAEQYFQEPYAGRIPSLFDGTKSLGEVKEQLTTDLTILLQPDFLASLRDGADYQLRDAVLQNSIPAWATNTPINLLHSPNDEVIGIANSTGFAEEMENAGSSNIVVTPLDAPGHRQAAIPMLINTIFWLEDVRFN